MGRAKKAPPRPPRLKIFLFLRLSLSFRRPSADKQINREQRYLPQHLQEPCRAAKREERTPLAKDRNAPPLGRTPQILGNTAPLPDVESC
jgi:hypothetical protein